MSGLAVSFNGRSENSFYYLEIDKEVNRVAAARIIFNYDDAPPLTNEPQRAIKYPGGTIYGCPVEIKFDNTEPVFSGVVIKYAAKSLKRGEPSVIIDCKDVAYRMTLEERNAMFYETTDENVIKELAKNHGVSFENVASQSAVKKELVQYRVSDWEFALNTAQHSGKCLVTDNGTLKLMDPLEAEKNTGFQPDVIEFEAEMDSRSQLSKANSASWDPGNQALRVVEAENAGRGHGSIGKEDIAPGKLASVGSHSGSLLRLSGMDMNELKEWTTSRVTQSHLLKVQARIRCDGDPGILLGQSVDLGQIKQLQNVLSGQGFISGIRYTISMQSFETDIQVGLPIENMHSPISSKSKHHLVPAVHGLHIGIVTQRAADGEKRIQVRIPVFDKLPNEKFSGQGAILWARLAAEYAGDGYGVIFRPEVDDEVVLGFLHGDPRQGIILGSLHSSARLSTIPEADGNPVKGIVTRSKMELLFNEDDKSVTIKSPGEKSITINDKEDKISLQDKHDNQLTMDKNGIYISCPQLKIECKGSMDVQARAIEMEGKSDVNLKSGSVMIQGNGKVDIKGANISIGKGMVTVGTQIVDGLGQSSQIIAG